jgi:hypothetical protein
MEEKEKRDKPFSLELARRGFPVMTRDGRPVRIMDKQLANSDYPLIGIIKSPKGGETVKGYSVEGLACGGTGYSLDDLEMAPVGFHGDRWVNIYLLYDATTAPGNTLFESREEAEQAARQQELNMTYLGTARVSVEWTGDEATAENGGGTEPGEGRRTR